jgi:putative nucleotidyltransferase with HDIG domain
LVEAFLEASSNDAFWLTLEPLNLAEFISTLENRSQPVLTQYDDIRKLARIFAHIVDAKSSFTYDHSMGVSQVARAIANLLELPKQRAALIELAGLLHDLGKLGVPDEILEKRGPLNADEAAIMHRHSYETFRILSRIKGFEHIAEWAGNHHETLIGDGYPFQHEETELSVEARIIAIADIFQALAQDRPYRKALSPEAILTELQELADAGKIDRDIVRLTAENIDTIWRAATNRVNDWMPSLLN